MMGLDLDQRVSFLVKHFALVYGTEKVWDGARRMLVRIRHLKTAYGREAVDEWSESLQRKTIMPADLAAMTRSRQVLPAGHLTRDESSATAGMKLVQGFVDG